MSRTSSQPTRSQILRSATAWSYGLTLGKMVITTGLALVLAAMLGPRAFGVIAMALVFTNFIEMIQQQGMMPAIIARKTLRDAHVDTAFWLVIGVGLGCTALGLAVAPWWAGLNDLPELTPVIQVLALGVPLTSSVVVHEALLRRELVFKQLAIRSWVSVLAGGAAGVFGAIAGWGVWALVAQQLVMNVTIVAVLWAMTPWRPRFRFSRTAATDLWSYSLRSASSSLGLFLGGRVDVILSGALFGPVVVGLYRMGHRLTTMVTDVTARSMQSVSLPGLARLQHDSQAFADRLQGMLRFTSNLALPVLGLAAGLAPAVERLLGDEWTGTTTAIRLLAISQAFSAMTLLLGPALQARGRPGTLAVVLWIWSGLTAAAIVGASMLDLAAEWRLTALCLAIVAATGGSTLILATVSVRVFGMPPGQLVKAVAPGFAAGVCAMAVSGTIMTWDDVHVLVAAAVGGLAGALVAVAVLGATDRTVRGFITRRRPERLDHTAGGTDGNDPHAARPSTSHQHGITEAKAHHPDGLDRARRQRARRRGKRETRARHAVGG